MNKYKTIEFELDEIWSHIKHIEEMLESLTEELDGVETEEAELDTVVYNLKTEIKSKVGRI